MKVEYINPFIESLCNTMSEMLNCSVARSDPQVKNSEFSLGDISGIIGFADRELSGAISLCFPRNTAFFVYEKMTGEKVDQIEANVRDAVGELANIVAGGAKTILSKYGISYHISIPTIVVGKNHSLAHKFNTPIVAIPFQVEGKPFTMEVVMKVAKKS